jgi:hypothetical protein
MAVTNPSFFPWSHDPWLTGQLWEMCTCAWQGDEAWWATTVVPPGPGLELSGTPWPLVWKPSPRPSSPK